MRQSQPLLSKAFIYALVMIGGLTVTFLQTEWAYFLGYSVGAVSFFFSAYSWIAFKRKEAEYQEEKRLNSDLLSPEIRRDRARSQVLHAYTEYLKLIKGLTPKQLQVASFLIPSLFDFGGTEELGSDRYYSHFESELVIFVWSEEKYGEFWRLPSQWDLSSGTRFHMVIKKVTDDLLSLGLARRENNKPNNRAYLTVSKSEAYKGLWAVEVGQD